MSASRHGLLLLHKKTGISSFDSLKGVKRAFATGKAGHTGTLDKFASGLLLVLVGRAVKIASLFNQCDKEYLGTVHFGRETDTLDPEGAVIAEGALPSREQVEKVLGNFRGHILQAPPAYSALHINGRRAHELVREGKEPLMKERPVTVHNLEIISWQPPEAVIHVSCSAGTYIRSLARDIALAAGSRAYLSSLTRTKIACFRLEDAAIDTGEDDNLVKALRPLDQKLFESISLPYFLLDEKEVEDFSHGKALEIILGKGQYCVSEEGSGEILSTTEKKSAGVFRKNSPDKLLGILEFRDGKWSYGHVFTDN